MTDRFFVDANVFVYGRDASEQAKQPDAENWLAALWRHRAGRTSMQALNEFYVTVTRKLTPPLPPDVARADVRDLLRWQPVPLSRRLVSAAWDMEDRFQLAFWDALIVAAAHAARCRYVLSEGFQAGQDYGGVVAINPFATSPRDLLASR